MEPQPDQQEVRPFVTAQRQHQAVIGRVMLAVVHPRHDAVADRPGQGQEQQDERERLPRWYADRGFVDFQVTNDSLHADSAGGKATLHVTVDEGQAYHVGTFDMEGNRRFSREDLLIYYPFGPLSPAGAPFGKRPFSQSDWDAATEKVQNLYANNGYIYAQVVPEESRRTGPDGTPMVDLRWTIREGSPATINKIEIVGNDVTHERDGDRLVQRREAGLGADGLGTGLVCINRDHSRALPRG